MIRILIYNNNIIENILDIMNMFPNRKFSLFRFSTSYRFFSNSSCRTQRTLKKSIYFSGISLHNGKQVNLSIHPSTHVNNSTGILFQTPNGMIPASYENVSSTNFCTTLCGFKTSNKAGSLSNIYFVHTVEHLLAAFYICNIQNAIVEIDGEELPILDGSSQPYCDAFEGNVAPIQNNKVLKTLKILKPIKVQSGDSHATFFPNNVENENDNTNNNISSRGGSSGTLSISVDVDFEPFSLPRDQIEVNDLEFLKEISSARTFTFEHVISKLKEDGLIKGGSMENAIVYDKNGIPLNKEPLRFENEFSRHKILDCIGDLSLLGNDRKSIDKIDGRYVVYKPGHTINNKMVNKLMKILEEEEQELIENRSVVIV